MNSSTSRQESGERLSHEGMMRQAGNNNDEIRQPEMSQSSASHRETAQSIDAHHWLVPDTRDDIVVSRIHDV